jgi:DnaJ like chaperone protein
MLRAMSIWGKIGGAAAGLVAGGPFGAALGALAGHFLVGRRARLPAQRILGSRSPSP